MKTPKQPLIEWTYQRRNWLCEEIRDKYPRWGGQKIPTRSFSDEAKVKLPRLYAEIERHNKKAHAANGVWSTSNEKRQETLVKIARLGTEDECAKLAKDLLK